MGGKEIAEGARLIYCRHVYICFCLLLTHQQDDALSLSIMPTTTMTSQAVANTDDNNSCQRGRRRQQQLWVQLPTQARTTDNDDDMQRV